MPTNEERREVAARLRVLADEGIVIASSYFVRDTFRVLGGEPPAPPSNPTLGDLQAYDQAFLYRLADLIEPEPERTCRNDRKLGNVGYHFRCSECGWNIPNTGSVVLELIGSNIKWCALCGAKVVEE